MHFDAELTEYLDRYMTEFQLPGYDCSVFLHHKEVFRRRVGYASLEAGLPWTESTLIHIYSNTKVIACVAALQLMERGLYKLNDPLYLYLPEFAHMKVRTPDGLKDARKPILIRDLFCMAAGIGDGREHIEHFKQFFQDTNGECPRSEMAQYLAAVPLLFEPGEGFCYGICHEVVALLIEKLTGVGFADYLKQHIFEPLGMVNTAFDPAECSSNELAVQYSYQGDGVLPKIEGRTNILIPPSLRISASGGLVSTVDDYMKFQEALCKENVLLRKETTDLMRRNHLNAAEMTGYGYPDNGLGYGLGVRTSLVGIGPYGWGGAAGTYGLIDPENELTVFYAQQMFGTRDIQRTRELEQVIYQV